MTGSTPVIGEYVYLDYRRPDELYQPWDPRAIEAAARVAALTRAAMPDAVVEHVGSTAVPGCDGKGIVDLLLLYAPGRLAAARDALDALGFQRQRGRDPFPEERPLRLGVVEHDGETFRLHVHVVAAGDAEAAELITFRDRLCADPALVAEYIARKRQVIAAGKLDNIAYNQGKEEVIRRIIDNGRVTHDA